MKKLLPVFAALSVIAAYLFSGMGWKENISPGMHGIQKVTEIPQQVAQVKKEGMAPDKYISAFAVKVSDGDTIEVTYKGESYKVRLLYIDTPESVKPGLPVQPYGEEASEFTKSMVLNKPVKLVFEKGLRDKYGRLLAHVILKDGEYLNGMLVRNGYARVEVVPPNVKSSDYFYRLQDMAVKEKAGLWGLPENEQPFVKDEDGDYVPTYWIKQKAS